MKKVLFLFLFLFPITVFSKTSKSEMNEVISNIENVQVEENIVIESVSISENKILMNVLENDIRHNVELDYIEDDISLSFSSGSVSIPVDSNLRNQLVIDNNDWAFYLYSIIENKTDIPYDDNNYYNSSFINDKLINLTDLEIQNVVLGAATQFNYDDLSHTFGVSFDYLNNMNNILNFKIVYHCYFDGEYAINKRIEDSSEITANPSTGNYQLFVTVMLIVVSGLAVYSFSGLSKNGEKMYEKNKFK